MLKNYFIGAFNHSYVNRTNSMWVYLINSHSAIIHTIWTIASSRRNNIRQMKSMFPMLVKPVKVDHLTLVALKSHYEALNFRLIASSKLTREDLLYIVSGQNNNVLYDNIARLTQYDS